MTKKALLVGISDYGGAVRSLQAPVTEIGEWRRLLQETYEFPKKNVVVLADGEAAKAAVRTQFTRLFDGAKKDDQLVFVFSGHGVRLDVRNGNGNGNGRRREFLDNLEEAILAHPGDATDMKEFAILDDELLGWYRDQNVPAGTDVTFIFDCCFGGGINLRDLPDEAAFMSVSGPNGRARSTQKSATTKQKRSLREEKRDNGTAIPVFVNAAGELNLAVEIKVEGAQRSNFGYHAIRVLRANPATTFGNLIDAIRAPMREFFPQFPNLQGNTFRANNPFLS